MRFGLGVLGLALVLAQGLACSQNASAPASAGPEHGAAEAPRPARTLPLPEMAPPQADQAAAEGGLVWDVPAGFVVERPQSAMRRAQYRVSGPGGDGECVVFYFGPGQGGDAQANAVRWANQFRQPDGSSSVDAMRMTELAGTRVPVQLVEVAGTYDGGMTMTDKPAEPKEHHMLLGGIAQGADALWFFKLTGPEATVRAAREAFIEMMESVRPAA